MVTDCPVYRAERRAWRLHPAFTALIRDPQAFVAWVTEREPFVSLRRAAGLSESVVTVCEGERQQTGCALAHVREQHIDLPHGAGVPAQGLLLHEVAHLCSPVDAHHDHRYVANYLHLVRHWLGTEAAEVLLRCLRLEGAFA